MEQVWRTFVVNIRMFVLGALWTAVGSIAPAVALVVDSLQRYDDPIDWQQVGHVAIAGAAVAVWGYWQKHKALLQPPPGILPPDLEVK